MFSGEIEASRQKLSHNEIQYIIGLLEQEYNGLSKAETFKGEYRKEKNMCDKLLKKMG